MEVLKQGRNAPLDVAFQVVIIYAVTKGYLADVPVEDVKRFEAELYPYMEANYFDILQEIRNTGKLSSEAEERLKEALNFRVKDFLG